MIKADKGSGHKVLILGNKCYRCSHEWRPYKIDTKPAVCPKCKNPYWSKPKRNSIDEEKEKQIRMSYIS